VTSALVVGAGAVGAHAAAQLSDETGIDRVLVVDADSDRAASVVDEVGGSTAVSRWRPGSRFPSDLAVVVCALPGDADVAVVTQAVEARIPAVTCSESITGVARLLDIDDAAREANVSVAVGAGLAPGLSEVLLRFATEGFDDVHEVHVARSGVAGPACDARRRRSLVETATETVDGAVVERSSAGGRRLVFFPPPVGPLDCRRSSSAVPLLARRVVPDLAAADFRLAVSWPEFLGWMVRMPVTHSRVRDLGAIHVEVRGRRGSSAEVEVFGLVDRMPVATGTILATAAAWVAGLEGGGRPAGSAALGEIVEAGPFLASLRRRGVRVARFDGDAAADPEWRPDAA